MVKGGASSWGAPNILIAILSLIMAGLGSYLAIQRDNGAEFRMLDTRVTAIKTEIDVRRPMRDQELAEIRGRLQRLEDRRGR